MRAAAAVAAWFCVRRGGALVAVTTLLPRNPRLLPACRYKRLDDSLTRLNTGMLQYVASLKRSCEDGRELVDMMDGFASADLRHRCVGAACVSAWPSA
jgi:hypothetical protein